MSDLKVRVGQRWRHKSWPGDGEIIALARREAFEGSGWLAKISINWTSGWADEGSMYLNNDWSPIHSSDWFLTLDVNDEG